LGEKREVPEEIKKVFKDWNRAATGTSIAWIVMVIISTIGSVFVAITVSFLAPIMVEFAAFLAAISVGLVNAFDMRGHARRHRTAWRILNAAMMRYEHGELTKEKLFEAYEKGEAVIMEMKQKIV